MKGSASHYQIKKEVKQKASRAIIENDLQKPNAEKEDFFGSRHDRAG